MHQVAVYYNFLILYLTFAFIEHTKAKKRPYSPNEFCPWNCSTINGAFWFKFQHYLFRGSIDNKLLLIHAMIWRLSCDIIWTSGEQIIRGVNEARWDDIIHRLFRYHRYHLNITTHLNSFTTAVECNWSNWHFIATSHKRASAPIKGSYNNHSDMLGSWYRRSHCTYLALRI